MNTISGAVLAAGALVGAAIYFRPEPTREPQKYVIAPTPNGAYLRADMQTGAVDFCTVGIDAGCVQVAAGPNR